MSVLVINCGSTSIKAAVIDPASGRRSSTLSVQRLGTSEACATLNGSDLPSPAEHAGALQSFLPKLIGGDANSIRSVGHRVVHGGKWFTQPTLLSDAIVDQLQETIPLAPLHNPANIDGIHAARGLLSNLPHVAVFDTAFHATIPRRARTYALPNQLSEEYGLRRYGFHGTSHQFVAHRVAEYLKEDVRNLRIITCHLGGGCSVCAVEYGRSIETSMGMTPLEGLVMATRSGDLDPAVLLHLMRSADMNADQLDALLNKQSGLAGLSGVGSDFRDIEQQAEEGSDDCRLAIRVFCHRIRKYVRGLRVNHGRRRCDCVYRGDWAKQCHGPAPRDSTA